MQHLDSFCAIDNREVQEPGDAIDVEEMDFVGPAREAYRNHGCARQELVLFPAFQRQSGQQVVVADYDIGQGFAGYGNRSFQTRYGTGEKSEIAEKSGEMVAQVWVSADTESRNILLFTGHALWYESVYWGARASIATGVSHWVDALTGQ